MFYNHLPNFIFRKLNLGTKTQKEIVLKSIRVLFLLLGLNLFLFPSFGQTPAQTLVTGTSFNPTNIDPDKTYYSEPEIEYYGTAPTRLSVGQPLTPDADEGTFLSDYQYGITDNPNYLATDNFIDEGGDFMYVASPTSYPYQEASNLLNYNVSGLKPNSSVTVIIDYCSVLDYTTSSSYSATTQTRIKIWYPNALGARVDYDAPQVYLGGCTSVTITGYANAGGNFYVTIKPVSQNLDASVGIRQIDVYGELDPKISSSQGSSACVGEQIQLRPQSISAGTYSWEVSTGGSW